MRGMSGSRSRRMGAGRMIAGPVCVALLVIGAMAVAGPSVAIEAPSATAQSGLRAVQADRVKALIVQYRPGYRPKSTGPLLGSSAVTGAVRSQLRLGPPLGLRMWRVDFVRPVTGATAARVARQLATHPAIALAEIDRPVSFAQ